MTDVDWANPAEAALVLGRIASAWRAHLDRAASSRDRAAQLRATSAPPPEGVTEADWRAFPDLLDAQAAEWDAAAAADAGEFRDAVAQTVAGGRLTRGQTAQLTAAASLDEAETAVAALKRDLF